MDHIIVNCETGETETRPMTDEETTALRQAQAEAQAGEVRRAQADQQRLQDAATVLDAMPSQARDALARLLNLA